MRWSLISTVSIIVLSIGGEVNGLPAPLPDSDGPIIDDLDARGFRIPRIPGGISRIPGLRKLPGLSSLGNLLRKIKPGKAPAKTPSAPRNVRPPPSRSPSPVRKSPSTPKASTPKARPARKTAAKAKPLRGPVKAKELKASSRTYRNAAAKSKNGVFKPGRGGKLRKHRGNGKVQKGLQADHIVEAQTVAKAINRSGRRPSRAAMRGAKKIVNSPQNMAFVDRKTNNRKGKDTAAALRGRPTSRDKNVQRYLRATKKPGEAVAKKLQDHFKKHRTPVDVQGAHRQVLRGNGLRPRESQGQLDALD